jgi:hypothetical protein
MNAETESRAALDGAMAVLPKKGRPTDYSKEFVQTFLELIVSGETLLSVSRRDDMPSHWSIYNWLREHHEFREGYELACNWRTFSTADSLRELIKTTDDDSVKYKCITFILEKEMPEKYGENPDVRWKPSPEVLANGDDAKLVNESPPQIIHQDPLQAQLEAFEKAGREYKNGKGS